MSSALRILSLFFAFGGVGGFFVFEFNSMVLIMNLATLVVGGVLWGLSCQRGGE